jgi:hypothetical protein
VSVFSVEGELVRHVDVGKLTHVGVRKFSYPAGVACSACDELLVADYSSRRVAVFSGSGEVLKTVGEGAFTGVAIHGGTIFAQDATSEKCVLLT